MKFDHHPDPAIAFCIEVECIEAMFYDRKVAFNFHTDLEPRIERAMLFRVGGDADAVAAKDRLRAIETLLRAQRKDKDGVTARNTVASPIDPEHAE